MTNFTSTAHTTPIYTIASGKGGVGKTSLALNLCHVLAKQGKKVLLLDADFGLANADVQLALVPSVDLSAVVSGRVPLAKAVTTVVKNFDLIAGRSGHDELAFMAALEQQDIMAQLRTLADNYDVVILDAAAGLDNTTLALAATADHTLLVTTPDPSAITDAYAFIKVLEQRRGVQNCQLIVNQATKTEGARVAEKIITAAKSFLDVELTHIATIPTDRQYSMAVKMQQVAAIAFPNCAPVTALEELARKLAHRA